MINLAFLRHGITKMNELGCIQGRMDIALSPKGIDQVGSWVLPSFVQNWAWASSPARRCQQTAALLLHQEASGKILIKTMASFLEMSWGEWEGFSVDELRRIYRKKMANLESLGLDFCPPGGESPRQVQQRILQGIDQLSKTKKHHVIVTHKGVIRAALSLATGWDMVQKPPIKLKWDALHCFKIDASGKLKVDQLNFSLNGLC